MVFDPQVPINRVTTNFYVVDIEEIASVFILKVFLWLLCVI